MAVVAALLVKTGTEQVPQHAAEPLVPSQAELEVPLTAEPAAAGEAVQVVARKEQAVAAAWLQLEVLRVMAVQALELALAAPLDNMHM